ncbi:MAG: transglycosylase domain-containing protein [Anaerolineae bacterium]|nr:transglycosylase domain-containing protein [Anaerolineae bacterium]
MSGEQDHDWQKDNTVPKHPGDHDYVEPPLSDDDTADMDIPDEDVPFKLPLARPPGTGPTAGQEIDDYNRATLRHAAPPRPPSEATLPGSGGLDPNPEMQRFGQETVVRPPSQPTLPNQAYATVPHPVPPSVPAAPVPRPAPPAIPAPDAGYTMPNPALTDDRRYQRTAPPGAVPAQGPYVPAPPPAPAQKQLPRRRQRSRVLGLNAGCLWLAVGLIVTFCGGTTLVTAAAAAIFIPRIEAVWEEQIARVDDYRSFESTFIYDRYGNELFEAFGEGRRVRVPYERFPRVLIDATIAIEDDSFRDNIGVDVPATVVAFLNYLGAEAGERTAGGSTITQQVVRNVLFDFEKRSEVSVQRKAEEIILAVLLTGRKSKDEILAMYLNEIYYGNLAYGAQTAAQTLFGKDVQFLTLGEAALLAGLPQSPAGLDPLNPDPAVQAAVYARQRQVLQEMVEEGYITERQREAALAEGLSFVTPDVSLNAPHFTVYARSEFERLMTDLGYPPEEVARGGFRVYTTVDQQINAMAQNTARTQVSTLTDRQVSNAAVIALKPLTGEILAMVGSIDYNSTLIDGRVNVTIALRQPGSTMKAFTYAAAMERGMTAGDVIWDTRTDIGIAGQPTYSPRNYDGRFHGPVTIRSALANSYNIPAVQTLRLVGVDYLLELMRRFGVDTLNQDATQYGLSLTLGGGEVSLVELTAGYAVFANQGAYVRPTAILCILNSAGDILYQYENGCPSGTGRMTPATVDRTGFGRQVLDPRIAYTITDVLSDNVARAPAMGTSSPLRTDGIASSVKTGTTNDYKDNWTVGYTRNLAVGVWVGNNDGTPMSNVSGLSGAAPIWNAVITGIYANPTMMNALAVGGQLLQDKPEPPGGMSLQRICDVRRLNDPAPECPATINEWFLDGPVGIPDGAGNLQFLPETPVPTLPGETIQLVSPGVYRALVFPIPESVAAGIQFQVNPGDKTPPPPRYCRVPASLVSSTPGIQDLLFIQPPLTSQGDMVEAENYARSAGLAILPTIDCWPELLVAAPPPEPGWGPGITTAVINSPASGETITGNVPIVGTVQFDASIADFYHIYIQGGPFTTWTPLGNPGYSSVVDGQLEMLMAEGLPPGTYMLRLALVRNGGFVQQPYDTTFIKP